MVFEQGLITENYIIKQVTCAVFYFSRARLNLNFIEMRGVHDKEYRGPK